jgi:hypothetical protein
LRRINLKSLGGRSEIEKHIAQLQAEELKQILDRDFYFVFDRDNRPASLSSSKHIQILQWNRYCIENYLIDIDVIYDVLREPDFADASQRKSKSELNTLLKKLAENQLIETVAKEVYEASHYEDPGFRASEARGKDFAKIGETLASRLETIFTQVNALDRESWIAAFTAQCETRLAADRQPWDENWASLCSGKRLFEDLRRNVQLKKSIESFKLRIIERMRSDKSDLFQIMKAEFDGILGVAALDNKK